MDAKQRKHPTQVSEWRINASLRHFIGHFRVDTTVQPTASKPICWTYKLLVLGDWGDANIDSIRQSFDSIHCYVSRSY